MLNFYQFTLPMLEEYFIQNGFKTFNARQLFEWVYKKNTTDVLKMTNISKQLKTFLSQNMTFLPLQVKKHFISADQTEKFLFELHDGETIETVLMKHNYGYSVCVTTQIGCNIGCSFCASGLHKKVRNLSSGEIVNQIVTVARLSNKRISHIVIMGIGEPFDNYQNTMDFIRIVNSPYGLEIGARHITVSTSGIVPKIIEFSNESLQVNLAISLHAPNNTIRTQLMSINRTYPIEYIINAVKVYIQKTNRRITFEYILLEGVNDQITHANQLSDLVRGINCYINLIRYNTVTEFNYNGSTHQQALRFYDQLKKRGINATLRQELGSDIDAACGQLRHKDKEV